jgi:methylated-DNA-[protein]-cysteine S-methyltransferase
MKDTLPDDIRTKMRSYSNFYQQVWRACAEIPAGETRTYGWIAARIGKPGAARAVGMALGANPFAPTVPCHRVVRSDGSMGGYSAPGGIAAKRRILAREGAKIVLEKAR